MLQRVLARLGRLLRSRGTGAFMLASLALGFMVGVSGAVLVWLIDLVESTVRRFGDWVGFTDALLLVIIPIGITISWLIMRRWGSRAAVDGVTEAIVGLRLHSGYLTTRLVPTTTVATAATLGTGGSGGREGPIALIGAAIGSSLGRYTHFGQDKINSLLAAGAGAGIGASFNAPIAGMLFALEVILGSFAIRHLNAVVIASVVAAVTTKLLVGDERILTSPAHELEDPRQLLLFAALALFAVLFGLVFLKVSDHVRALRSRSRLPPWLVPVVAGLIVASIGLILPETLGTGQDFLQGLLSLEDAGGYVWWTLLAIGVAKGVTNAVTKTGGGSAGTFMPSLVIGGAVGAGFAILVDPLWGLSDINPGAFAVVGMAATFASVARAPLTSVVIVFEITGDYGLVLPLMLGAALATYLGERFHPDSEYTAPLTRLGIHLPSTEDIDLLDTVTVRQVMSECDTVSTPEMDLASLERLLAQTRHHGVPVIDSGGRLAGMVTVSDIEACGGAATDLTVADAMSTRPITVTADQPVSAALARMAALGVGRMPVVAEDDPMRIVGMFRRESVVRAYHHALGTATGRELYRERVRQRTDPGAAFFEVQLLRGSPVSGTRVREIDWPKGATLVSVRRGAAVLIPHGETRLEVGDVLTAFGTGTAREELAARVEPGDEPTGEWRHPLIQGDDDAT